MPSYPLPPWLSPSAAQGYGQLAGEADRAALSAQLEREQMSQRATQFAIEAQQRSQQTAAEMQARQEQLNYEHQMEQQKIALDQAYKQQQISLDTQSQQLAQNKFDAATQATANKAAAVRRAQKAMLPKEQGGEGLSATEAYLREVAPYMSGVEIGKLAGSVKPPTVIRPAQDIPGLPGYKGVVTSEGHIQVIPPRPSVSDEPLKVIPIHDEDGKVIGHYSINPVTGKAELIRQQTESSGDQMLRERMAQKGLGPKAAPAAAPSGDFGPQMVPPPPVRPLMKSSTAVDSGGPDLSQVTILPSKKEDLKEGILYFTSRGPAVWNGTNFVKQ